MQDHNEKDVHTGRVNDVPPSESLWFEEIAKALIPYVSGIVKVERKGALVSVPCIIRKPDEDFKVEQYPVVSIYNLFSEYDPVRDRRNEDIFIGRVGVDGIYEKVAIPFNLQYQFDFWSIYQVDMDNMLRWWLGENFNDFNVPAKDMAGIDRFVYFKPDTRGVIKSDLMGAENRIFHSLIRYMAYTELDERVQRTEKVVLEVIPETYKKVR